MKEKLFKYLESNKKDVVALLSKLIAIPTINPPGENYEEMVSFLERQCRALDLNIRKYVTPKRMLDKFGVMGGSKRISLVADWPTRDRHTLHINSHYDVVPATDKWKTHPFKAVIKGGRLYGRGAEDMKGNISCLLFGLKAMRGCGITPKVNLEFSFTPDEETGGRTGLGYLVHRNLVKADYAMSEGYAQDYVSIGNKGVLWAEVTVEGSASHASMPHRGVNAFERMVELVNEMEKLKKNISGRKTRYDMRDTVSRGSTFVMGGLLKGGIKVNVVPGVAKFSIDRRLIPEEDVGAAKKEIESLINRFNRTYRDSKVHVKFMAEEAPSISKKDKGFLRLVSDAIKMSTGRSAKFCIMPGATDMRYFMRKGVPCVGYSAKGGESWHSDNEFVYIDSLIDTA
ncbi:MAG: M20 family metallopeptidase, partial [Candidatus Omnitrophica bacterium]|nr:M20 family metallopeptidase [Candidatus Omnitrophota bacterium]